MSTRRRSGRRRAIVRCDYTQYCQEEILHALGMTLKKNSGRTSICLSDNETDRYSPFSSSKVQYEEEIEVFEESDYSDVSSQSKYSTCTDNHSEFSDDATTGKTIKREIRDAE
jgi:hypothetical protein